MLEGGVWELNLLSKCYKPNPQLNRFHTFHSPAPQKGSAIFCRSHSKGQIHDSHPALGSIKSNNTDLCGSDTNILLLFKWHNLCIHRHGLCLVIVNILCPDDSEFLFPRIHCETGNFHRIVNYLLIFWRQTFWEYSTLCWLVHIFFLIEPKDYVPRNMGFYVYVYACMFCLLWKWNGNENTGKKPGSLALYNVVFKPDESPSRITFLIPLGSILTQFSWMVPLKF